jgi:protein TonB
MTAHTASAGGVTPAERAQRAIRGAAAHASQQIPSATGAMLSAGLHAAAIALALGALGAAQGPQPVGEPAATVTLITAGMFEAAGSRAPSLPPGGPPAPPVPSEALAAQTAAWAPAPTAPPAATHAPVAPPALVVDASPRVIAEAEATPQAAQAIRPEPTPAEPLSSSDDAASQLAEAPPHEFAAATHAPPPPSRPLRNGGNAPPNRTRAANDASAGTTATPAAPAAPQGGGPSADLARRAIQTAPGQDSGSTQDDAGRAEDSMARSRYRAEISRRIERAKRVGSGGEGVGAALVELTIDASGGLVGATLAESSGLAMRDAAALSTVRRAAPFPAPPPELASDRLVLRVRFR